MIKAFDQIDLTFKEKQNTQNQRRYDQSIFEMSHTYDKKQQDSASKAVMEFAMILGAANKAVTVEHQGRQVQVNRRTIGAWQRALTDLYKKSLSKRGKKSRSPDEIAKAVSDVQERIDNALANSFPMGAPFRRVILRDVPRMLEGQAKISSRAFDPKPLSFLDDAFVRFFSDIDLDLARATFAGEPQALQRELGDVNASVASFLTTERVCASTVLQAIMSHYVGVNNLRVTDPRYTSPVIRLDGPLRALLRARMDSSYEGEVLARHYKANDKPPSKKEQTKAPKIELGRYRQMHPNKSVEEFVLERARQYAVDAYPEHRDAAEADERATRELLRDDLMPGQVMLVLINAHLINKDVMVASGRDSATVDGIVSSDPDSAGREQNPYINNLLTLQTLVKLTTLKSDAPRDAPPSAAAARSPPRSAAGSPARSARGASRSPGRSPASSPGRRVATRR